MADGSSLQQLIEDLRQRGTPEALKAAEEFERLRPRERGVPWTYYVHFPGLVIPAHAYGIAGVLRQIDQQTLDRLSPDFKYSAVRVADVPNAFWMSKPRWARSPPRRFVKSLLPPGDRHGRGGEPVPREALRPGVQPALHGRPTRRSRRPPEARRA